MKKLFISIIVSLFFNTVLCILCLAQTKYNLSKKNDFQYGVACKISATIETGRLQLNASANAGIGMEVGSFLYPAYNIQFQIYNGGHGTNYKKPVVWPPTSDIAHSFMLTIGFDRPYTYMEENKYLNRNSPLYHFSDFTSPALQNPYNYSISLGTNHIQAFGPDRARFQRLGFFNIHLHAFQLGYSNDGSPFGLFSNILGDLKDRYYTGDGFVAVHLPRSWEANTFIFSYHKFTGFYDSAFELSNLLFVANVEYKDTTQQYFNRSMFTLTISNVARGFSLSASCRNKYFKDVQHLIHRNDYWTLHQVPYSRRFGISAALFKGTTKLIPLK